MTNAEAIETLRANYPDTCFEQLRCAVDMAIKALEEPQRKKGRWEIYVISMLDGEGCKCSECGFEGVPYWDFCPNCGADMRTPVETARDIVHKAIDNSAWSDTVDTAKMHKVVDDKYAEMTKKTEESNRCDTCKHEKARWFSRCADCSDYELWEGKEE